MNHLWWDLETTDLKYATGGILQAGFKLTSDTFQVLDEFETNARIKVGIVPSVYALLKNSVNPLEAQKRNKSSFQLIKEVHDKMIKWSPFISTTFNGISFDENFARFAFNSSLLPVYITQGKNKRLDILNVLRATSIFDPGKIKYSINKDGNDAFGLEDISRLNNIAQDGFHDAAQDVNCTIELAKIISERCPIIWKSAVMSCDPLTILPIIQSEKFFATFDTWQANIYTRCLTFVTINPSKDNQVICFDLANDPQIILNHLNDYDGLKKLIEAKPKPTRTIKYKASPIILNAKYALKHETYSRIGINILEQRANKIIENRNVLAERIGAVYKDIEEKRVQKRKENIDKLKPEELLYDIGFPNEKDQQLMVDFHKTDDWSKKVNFIGKFDCNNAIYSYFATRIIYEETGDTYLPPDMYKGMHREIASRILSEKKENFMTCREAEYDLDQNYAKFEEAKDEKNLNLLKDIDTFIQGIRRTYENA
jgi:exonuclease I